MPKTIYISGRITGEPNFKEIFNAAEKKLVELGYTVINPVGFEKEMTELNIELSYENYIRYSLTKLDGADTIYMLSNWTLSKGACVELFYAKSMFKKVYYEIDHPIQFYDMIHNAFSHEFYLYNWEIRRCE